MYLLGFLVEHHITENIRKIAKTVSPNYGIQAEHVCLSVCHALLCMRIRTQPDTTDLKCGT